MIEVDYTDDNTVTIFSGAGDDVAETLTEETMEFTRMHGDPEIRIAPDLGGKVRTTITRKVSGDRARVSAWV